MGTSIIGDVVSGIESLTAKGTHDEFASEPKGFSTDLADPAASLIFSGGAANSNQGLPTSSSALDLAMNGAGLAATTLI